MTIDTKALKPGDEVAVEVYTSERTYDVGVVKSVSKTGQVTLQDGRRFKSDGLQMGMDHSFRSGPRLAMMTADRAKFIRDEPYLKVIQSLNSTRFTGETRWGKLPTDALRRIAEIIDANRPGGN